MACTDFTVSIHVCCHHHLICQLRVLHDSDTRVKILLQGSVPAGQQMRRDHSAGVSSGRGTRDTPQRLRRQHSELPFHSAGRAVPSTSTDRTRPESRSKQPLDSADFQGASGTGGGPRGLERQHSLAVNIQRHVDRQPSSGRTDGQGSSTAARLEHRPSSRQHSRQKSRPSSATQPAPKP